MAPPFFAQATSSPPLTARPRRANIALAALTNGVMKHRARGQLILAPDFGQEGLCFPWEQGPLFLLFQKGMWK